MHAAEHPATLFAAWRRGLELNEWLVAWWQERERELVAELEHHHIRTGDARR